MKHFPLSALALACTVALTACGGGGGSSAPSVSSTNTSANSNTGTANSNVNIPSGSNQDAAAKAAAAAKDQAAIAAQKAAEEAKAKAEAEAAAAKAKAEAEAAAAKAKAEAEAAAAKAKAEAEAAAAKAKAEAEAAAAKAKAEAEKAAAEKAAAEKAAKEAEEAKKAAEEAAAKAKTEAEAAAAKKAAEEAEAAKKAAEEEAAKKAAEQAEAARKAAEAEAAAKKAAEEAAKKAEEEAAKNSGWNALFKTNGTIMFKGKEVPALKATEIGGGILKVDAQGNILSALDANSIATFKGTNSWEEIILDGHKLYLLDTASDKLYNIKSREIKATDFDASSRPNEFKGYIGSTGGGYGNTWEEFRWGLVQIGDKFYAFSQGKPASATSGGRYDSKTGQAHSAKFTYSGRAAYVRNGVIHHVVAGNDMLVEVDLTGEKKQIAVAIQPPKSDYDGNRPRELMVFGGDINGNTFEGTRNGIHSKGAFYDSTMKSVSGIFQGVEGVNKGVVGAFGASGREPVPASEPLKHIQ